MYIINNKKTKLKQKNEKRIKIKYKKKKTEKDGNGPPSCFADHHQKKYKNISIC